MSVPSESLKQVFDRIRDDDLVDLARGMIAIPSPNFEEGAVADFLAERMTAIGMEVDMMTVEHPTDASKVTRQPIGRLRGSGGGPTLMFNGHTDVNVIMPGWTVDPLKVATRTADSGDWAHKTTRAGWRCAGGRGGDRRRETAAQGRPAVCPWRRTSSAAPARE